jgi:effector-binding domain-containing protein
MNNTRKILCCTIAACAMMLNCKNKSAEKEVQPTLIKKDTQTKKETDQPSKGPIINLVDTVESKRTVLCLKDSAATSAGMTIKLEAIYNKKLPEFIKANKLTIAGSPMAWYKSQKAPFFFEAGLPVDKAPPRLAKGTYIKKTGADSCIVAHFFGPYDLTSIGYEALTDFIKEHKKIKAAAPYEVYINSPFDSTKSKTIDPYKLQTDIVFPYK